MLDWGVDLGLPISKQTINGVECLFADGNTLVACFDSNGKIDDAFIKELGKSRPLRVVFRDRGFKDDAAKINAEQILRVISPETDVKVI
jgi:adenine-specific DNA-methyltransferase